MRRAIVLARRGALLGTLGCAFAGAGPASAATFSELVQPAHCRAADAADADVDNGLTLPFTFCDDGIPAAGGRTANAGALNAIAVPQRYADHVGLPPKAMPPDANAGADANGDIAIDADLTFPDPGRNPMPTGGYPLVVFMHGCCAGQKVDWEAPTVDGVAPSATATNEKWHYNNAWFAARGYVVLNYTSRGFVNGEGRGSTGETQLDDRRYEMNDFQHLAGQIADTTFTIGGQSVTVNPQKVVTTGGSYGGGFSWLALTDPTWQSPGGKPMRLAATAPRYGWTDLLYSLIPNGMDRRDELPAPDGSTSSTPFGFPKRSIVAGLFASGTTGTPDTGNPARVPSHATFPTWIDEALACVQSSDPFEQNPLCARTLQETVPSFIADRSAYYQNHFFDRIARDATARVPIFSAGTLTDTLFPSHEHRRMGERLRSVVPGYPIQEYYGDFQHFAQNKPKEWGDVCGPSRAVCRFGDYPGGNLSGEPPGLLSLGITTRLNRFIDFYAKPPANPSETAPRFDVTASLQVCRQNATEALPADEPGPRFTAGSFAQLAPNTLRVEAPGMQATTHDAEPNPHAANSEPIFNEHGGNRKNCPAEQAPGGASSAGPGVGTYDSAVLPSDFTMIGRTRVTVPHTGAGAGIQLNARLYDLFPGGGPQVMVDRGVRRVTSPNGTTVFDLHGNGWRFPAGHRIRIELAQDDDPYIKRSNQPSSLMLSGTTLEIPIREQSTTIGGGVAPDGSGPGGRDRTRPRLKLSVKRRQRLHRRGILVAASCSERCTVRLRAAVSPRRVGRRVRVRAVKRTLRPRVRVRMRLVPSKRGYLAARRALRRGSRLTLTIRAVATDPAGNRTSARRRVRLRR